MPRKEISKNEFVAGLPVTMPAAEVVAKGARIGIELSQKQVSNIRSHLKMKAAVAAEAAPTKGPKLRRARTVTTTATTTVKRRSSNPPAGASVLALPPLNAPKVPRGSLEDARVALKVAAFRLGLDESRRLLDELERMMNE